MRNIAKRSVAMLLLVVMVFSVCQGALVSTFADDTGGSTDPTTVTEATEPSEAVDDADGNSVDELSSTGDSGGPGDSTEDPTTAPTETTDAAVDPTEEATTPSDTPTDPSVDSTEPTAGSTDSTAEPTEPASGATEPTETVTEPTSPATEPTEETTNPTIQYERMEAEEDANVSYFNNPKLEYENASNGYVVGEHQIENAFQLELYDDLATSSLQYIPYVKYNVSTENAGTYELHIGVAVENISYIEDFYIPVVVDGEVYKAVCEDFNGENGIYEFVVSVNLEVGKNLVYCIAYDADTYLKLTGNDPDAVASSIISFDYLDIPEGVSALEKDEEPAEETTEPTDPTEGEGNDPVNLPEVGEDDDELVIPSPDIIDPDGSGEVVPLDEGGSEGSGTGNTGGGAGIGGSADYAGGYLTYTQAGVTMQVLFYPYEDIYSAETLHNQVKNSVLKYNTSSDNARNENGTRYDGSSADLTTIFDPDHMTETTYFIASQQQLSKFGKIYRLDSYPSNFPSNRIYSSTFYSWDKMGTSKFPEVTDTDVANFMKRIILGNSYGSWDIGDVYGDGNAYAKVLQELGVSSTAIANYQKAYNGELSLVDGQDLDGNGVEDTQTLIPVVVWKYVIFQDNTVNSSSQEGENKSYLITPYDIAYDYSSSLAESWWKTPYNWDYTVTDTTYNGNSVKKYESTVQKALAELAGIPNRCGWNPDASYACKMLFGTGHSTGHGGANYSWYDTIASTDLIGSGFVNMIASGSYTAKSYGNPGYHFRGFWGPFGADAGSGSVTITKVSSANSSEKLSGATYVLYKDAACTSPVTANDYKTYSTSDTGFVDAATRTTNANGIASYTGLYVGSYFLKETVAPSGYKLDSTAVTVSIVRNGSANKTLTNEPDSQPFTLQKRCNTSCATQLSGNAMYSLAGAQYEVYVGGVYQETLTTDANGNATSSQKYPNGTVITVKEVKASPGYVITNPATLPSFTVTNNAANNVFTVYENPTFDPATRGFYKVGENADNAQGNTSFEGAIFKWEYYDNTSWSGTPVRTWYFKTDSDGYHAYNADYLVNSSSYPSNNLYSDGYGYYPPLGSIKITEVHVPVGYKAMPTLYATISQPSNGANARWSWSDETKDILRTYRDGNYDYDAFPEPDDDSSYGRISIQKTDSQTGTTKQGDVTSHAAKFQVINRSTNSVKIGNNAVAAPGAVCYEFWTDANGNFTSGYIFPIGTYEVKEVTPPTGMLINSTWSKTFTVTETNKDFTFSGTNACADPIIRGGFSLVKIDENRFATTPATDDGTPQGDAVFTNATFNVINKSSNPVVVNGTTYAVGAVCYTFKVGADGTFTSAANLLPYGTYQVVESAASAGYKVDSDWSATFSIRTDGTIIPANSITSNPVAEPVIRGGVSVQKKDALSNSNNPQGNSSLEGAVLKVVNKSTNAVYTDRDGNGNYAWYAPGEVCLYITTNAKGVAASATNALPYGSYRVSEHSASNGYLLNSSWYKDFTIRTDGAVAKFTTSAEALPETVIRGVVTVQKKDAIANLNSAEGEATLAGAVLKVINNSTNSVYTDRDGNGTFAWYKPGEVCLYITTDANGVAKSSTTALPYGSYRVMEHSPSTGYLLNTTWYKDFIIRTDGQMVAYTTSANALPETVILGGVKIYKYDTLLGTNTTEIAKLDGITYSIYSENNNYVVVNGVTYNKGDVVATITVAWDATEKAWIAKTGNKVLPYGTYTVRENPMVAGSEYANAYYALSSESYTFSIREDGVIVTLDTSNRGMNFHNMPLARIELEKVNTSSEHLAGVKFSLEWSEDGNTWTPVHYVPYGVFEKGGSTTVGITNGCLVTDKNGSLSYEGLDPTLQYRLVEVETLDGYMLLKDPVFKGILGRNDEAIVEYQGRVVNTESFTLPKTGSEDMAFLSLAIAICATICFGALVYCRKKEQV